jgi:hypothetical protein
MMPDKSAETLLGIGIAAGALVGASIGFEFAGFFGAILGAIIGSVAGSWATAIAVVAWAGLACFLGCWTLNDFVPGPASGND